MKSTGYPPPHAQRTTEQTRRCLKLTNAITAGFAGILAFANVHAVELTVGAEHPAQWLQIKPNSWTLLQNNDPNSVNINVYDSLSVSTNVIQAVYQEGADVTGNKVTIQSDRETPWFTGLKLNGVQVEKGNAYDNRGCHEFCVLRDNSRPRRALPTRQHAKQDPTQTYS